MMIEVKPVPVEDITPWRDLHRAEMRCQIVMDNMPARPGWTQPYFIEIDGRAAGYGLIAIAGPWKGTKTVFEYYLAPSWRKQTFDCFEAFLDASQASAMTVQTNDPVLTVMFHQWARDIVAEKMLFADGATTHLCLEGATLLRQREPEQDWRIEIDRKHAANGGILYHYNRPYGDIYMEVVEPYRRRGIGSFLVQELKRICYEGGSIPCARCNPDNIASRNTLQKAGFVPCANILNGKL